MRRILVALAVLAAFAVTFHLLMEKKESREKEEAGSRRLLTVDERAVNGVRATLDGVEWAVDRAPDGTWSIVKPIRDPADSSAVMNLLRLMNQTEVVDSILQPEPLPAYGLAPARLEIRLLGVDAPVLRVGNETPTGNTVFMQVGGREGVLVAAVDVESPFLNPDANRLRDRSLPGMALNDVSRVVITRGGQELSLAREGEHWWITRPRRLPASQSAITGVLEALGNAEVVGFVDGADPADARFQLGESATAVELSGNAADCRILLGRGTDAGIRFARRDGRDAIMAVAGEGLFGLPQDADALLDTRLTKANRYKVRWFRYRKGGRSLELRRNPDGEGWSAGDGAVLANDDVYPMLVRLLEGRLQGWREGDRTSLPQASLEYQQEDGLTDKVLFWKDGAATLESVPGVVFSAQVRLPGIPG